MRCVSITHYGTQCLRNAMQNSEYCWQHYNVSDVSMEPTELKESQVSISEIESSLIDDFDVLNFKDLKLTESESNVDQSMLLPELESIVGSYLDVQSFLDLNRYNPKIHSVGKYLYQSNTQLYDSIELDNLELFVRFLNNKPVDSELLNYIISNDSVSIFKSLNLQINDSTLETIAQKHAFKILTYLSGLEQYSRRKKFFLYISIFKKAILHNDLESVQFFVQSFKLNIRNNINEYLSYSKRNPEIYNYLLQFK